MIRAAAWVIATALLAAPVRAGEDARPLLELARALWEKQSASAAPASDDQGVRALEHEIAQSKAPPDAECARSLGAQRFAFRYLRLGNERMSAGAFTGAVEAFRHAHSCRPRDVSMYERLADALFAARDYAAARAAVKEGLALDPRSPDLYRIAGILDFVAGSWADAAARFRYVAAGEPVRALSEEAQLLFWLAQRRAGVPEPRYVERAHDDTWPRPLMRVLAGEIPEERLLGHLGSDDGDTSDYQSVDALVEDATSLTSVRVSQALFYVGESHWADGDTALAREYLAAAINLKNFESLEHRLALAEIAKLR